MNKKHELIGIGWFAASLFLFILLLFGLLAGSNMGLAGRLIKMAFFYVFGYASFIVPVIFGIIGYYGFKKDEPKKPVYKIGGISLFLLASCLFLYLIGVSAVNENMLGYVLGLGLEKLVSSIGSWIVFGVMVIFSLYFLELEYLPKNAITVLWKKYLEWRKFKKEKQEEKKLERSRKQEVKKAIKEEKRQIQTFEKEKTKTEPVRIDATRGDFKVKPAEKRQEKTSRSVSEAETESKAPQGELKEYVLPSYSLLADYESAVKMGKEDFRENENIIKLTLSNFGIEVEPSRTVMGPVVTRYEVKVAAGQKVNKIVALSNDLAMALRATHIRIIAPIPGTNAVGIEVPNKKYSTVSLKSIISSSEFNNPSYRLPVSIGKTVDGENMVADLADMPHLLVAGATGAGKSVCLNSIIVSLLYKFRPEDLKLLLIDPKRVEFSLYNDIPHLYTPVITDVRKAFEALKHLCRDMVDRYNKLSQAHARDIVSYNKKAGVKLPYIVVVIDEHADMMLLAAREIEDVITRLAQLARGVGIHLVFATQRPSVDVITGVIKANFPSRIALQVFSKVDSRVILDTGGAEDLLGKGDMLFSLASFPRPVRCQCSYISTAEIKDIMDFWKEQGKPEMVSIEAKSETGNGECSDEDNDLFLNALVFVKERKRASVQLLQGAFHISGGRATNLISLMESRGIIGPGIGNKPRDINFDGIEEILKKNKKA
ncbi:MAG: DNA translocase FtsK 4TM domain-containing protein [Candidatus Firestonebacteria bacterium]